MKATNIVWETDGEKVDLPEEVEIPKSVSEEGIADWLSDQYGFLVESYSLDHKAIKEVKIHLEDWTEHYPTGAVIHYYDGTEESDFCDSLEDFKRFLGEYKKDISLFSPRITVSMNIGDLETSNVINAAKEIAKFLQS